MNKLLTSATIMALVFIAGCQKNEITKEDSEANMLKSGVIHSNQTLEQTSVSILGSASTFAVLGGTTVTNAEASIITGDAGVSPGTALTGFEPEPINTIEGPGTVTPGPGIVNGTIYAGGPVAALAHNDAVLAYNDLVAMVPDVVYSGVTQLDGMIFKPGVYSFESANLQVDGKLYLDFEGNSDALFIFQVGTTLVTMTNSNVIAIHLGTTTCLGSNVYWAVGTSATIDGDSFIGTVIATTTITMTNTGNDSGATNVDGRMLALNGEVTMVKSMISTCGTSDGGTNPPELCRDFVTGGGWIKDKETFGVSGGIKNDKFWGQLSFNNHNGVKVKSTSVTGYFIIDAVTRQIEGTARLNGKTPVTYTVIVTDNGEPGRDDSFSIVIPNLYSASGTLKGGNIQLHKNCGESHGNSDKEDYNDKNEQDGHKKSDK